MNGSKILEAVIKNCKVEFCATTAPVQEGSLLHTHQNQMMQFFSPLIFKSFNSQPWLDKGSVILVCTYQV